VHHTGSTQTAQRRSSRSPRTPCRAACLKGVVARLETLGRQQRGCVPAAVVCQTHAVTHGASPRMKVGFVFAAGIGTRNDPKLSAITASEQDDRSHIDSVGLNRPSAGPRDAGDTGRPRGPLEPTCLGGVCGRPRLFTCCWRADRWLVWIRLVAQRTPRGAIALLAATRASGLCAMCSGSAVPAAVAAHSHGSWSPFSLSGADLRCADEVRRRPLIAEVALHFLRWWSCSCPAAAIARDPGARGRSRWRSTVRGCLLVDYAREFGTRTQPRYRCSAPHRSRMCCCALSEPRAFPSRAAGTADSIGRRPVADPSKSEPFAFSRFVRTGVHLGHQSGAGHSGDWFAVCGVRWPLLLILLGRPPCAFGTFVTASARFRKRTCTHSCSQGAALVSVS